MVNARIEFARLAASRVFADIDIDTPFAFPTPEDPAPLDPESAAEAIRRVWRIPPGPIDDLVLHIENAGAIVLPVDFGVDTILAAYSHIRDDYRWCFLNTRAVDGARTRFSLAHELGHALLHWDRFDAPTDKDAEREAHRFAAALLMPAHEMHVLFGRSRLSLNELLVVRRQWKVSVQALVMRAYDLGLLSSHQRARYFQQISARGWRKAEPGLVDVEQPSLFGDALRMHRRHHGYTDDEIAALTGLPAARLADLMPEHFSAASVRRPRLSIVKESS
jgi:Zn-dependent peptidase ImmA (M78 family)